MPRPPRVQVDGAVYYVTASGFEGRPLFRDRQDYEAYLGLLQEYQERHGYTLYAYALLPTSVHLVLELPESGSLSDVMHDLSSRYTKHANRRSSATGHLFQERFKSVAAEKPSWLLRLTAFVHLLPQRDGLVADAMGYAWSSASQFLAVEKPDGGACVAAAEILHQVEVERPGVTYADLLRGTSPAYWQETEALLRRPAVGSNAFLARATQALQIRRQPVHLEAPAPATAPWRLPAWAVTALVSVACVFTLMIGLYTASLASLRQTLRAVAQEHALPMPEFPQPAAREASGAATAVPASVTLPSRLNGSRWNIRVASPDGQSLTDELSFAAGRVTSRALSAQGFTPSNYTLSVSPEGQLVWETMQTNTAGETVCWRGEWNGQNMRGVMTRQAQGTQAANASFLGSLQAPANEAPGASHEI